MARKKKPEEHVNHERWLVSYADFITLLFAFFVVMYSVSSVNEGKYRVLSDSMVSAFSTTTRALKPIQVGSTARAPQPSNILSPSSSPQLIKKPITVIRENTGDGAKGDKDGAKALSKIADGIEEAMSDLIGEGMIGVSRHDLWVEIEIKNSVLFPSGSAQLHLAAVPVLKEIARVLYDFSNHIQVEGFTDNIPINTMIYPSNWELSASRASSVVRLFYEAGVNPTRLSAIGFGEYHPIADNNSAEGRAQNRRIILSVMANHDMLKMLIDKMSHGEKDDAVMPVATPASTPVIAEESVVTEATGVDFGNEVVSSGVTAVVEPDGRPIEQPTMISDNVEVPLMIQLPFINIVPPIIMYPAGEASSSSDRVEDN